MNLSKQPSMKCHMYILECGDRKYYTGSTKYLELRIAQHQAGEGAQFTKNNLPVKLVYSEEFTRIDWAFNREKQVQGWGRKKKEALINGELHKLSELSKSADLKGFRQAQPPLDKSEMTSD